MSEPIEPTTQAEEHLTNGDPRPWRRYKILTLAALFLLTVVFAILDVLLVDFEGWEFLSILFDGISFSIGVLIWCSYDSAEHGWIFTKGYRVFMFLIPPLGFPAYALKTRGIRGFRLIGWAVLFLAAMLAVTVATTYITEYLLELIQE